MVLVAVVKTLSRLGEKCEVSPHAGYGSKIFSATDNQAARLSFWSERILLPF
jgi:hypothetical protein